MTRARHTLAVVLLLSLTGLVLSCEGEVEPDAGAPDAGGPPRCEAAEPYETGDDGSSAPLDAPAGEVRAGRLTAAMLPADRTGLGVWDEGDFVIANDRFALMIEAAGASDLYDPFGGRPVGVARVEGGALVEAGDFNEILFGFGAFLVNTETVTVLNDGADGGAAVIRAAGVLGPLEFAGELLTTLTGAGDYGGIPATMDYEMQPGSDAVDVFMNLTEVAGRGARTPFMLTAFFQRYRMPIWTPETGFVVPTETVPVLGFIDDTATSYAWFPPEGLGILPLTEQAGVLVTSTGPSGVSACESVRIPVGTLLLGGPGLAGLQGSLARRRGDTLRTVTGTISNADGSPALGARVHVRDASGRHFARIVSETGSFEVEVPNETVTFEGHRPGLPVTAPVSVDTETDTVAITLPPSGTLRIHVEDQDGAVIPARIQVLPAGGVPPVPEEFGERGLPSGRSHLAFSGTEDVVLEVAPGAHQVIVSRGFEYELDARENVMITEGAETMESFTLEHVVDSTGVMCADYHIHTHRSPDSPDSPQIKLQSLVADGLEIAIRADHEWVNDFQPVIEELGLSAFARGLGGEELTTFAWGHFGVFPLTEDRTRPSGGRIDWVGRLPPAVFADVRARPEQPALIIHHPRSGGVLGGYFTAAGFNRTTGIAENGDHWDDDFELVEFFNDASFDESRDSTVADWFSLLGTGRRVFTVGSSDSHNYLGSPVGYPRTCLAIGIDDPTLASPEDVRDVTRAGHSVVSGGIFLTVEGPGGVGPGDEATGVGDLATFRVRVQAPSWVRGVTELEVWVDGELHETFPITEDGTLDATRFDESNIEVPVAASGSWVIFHARSTADLAPVNLGRDAFGVSNPVFLTR